MIEENLKRMKKIILLKTQGGISQKKIMLYSVILPYSEKSYKLP